MDDKNFYLNSEGVVMPRHNTVTDELIDSRIIKEQYHVFDGTTVTVCVLTLVNEFTVIGESACADPANFNEGTGRHYARRDATTKIGRLEGYLLRQQLHEGKGKTRA